MAKTSDMNREMLPAIVLGSDITALGTGRALGMAGIPAYLISAHKDFARTSRWVRPLMTDVVESADPGNLTSLLDASGIGEGVLMPCSDTWTRAVSSLEPDTKMVFRTSLPSRQAIMALTDKGLFADALERLDIPRPRTYLVDWDTKLPGGAEADPAGYFLKPRDSQAFSVAMRTKGIFVKDSGEATEVLKRVRQLGLEVVLQEYIPGPVTNNRYIDGYIGRDGSIRALFARKKLQMFPTDMGNSTLMETVGLEGLETAIDSLTRLLGELDYRGIFSGEFKWDDRDGSFKLLEINARPWWFIEFAAMLGVNVALLAYREAAGLPITTVDNYETGVRHKHLLQHLRAYLELRKTGQMSLTEWIQSMRGARDAVFRLRDPMPGLAMVLGYGKKGLQRGFSQPKEADVPPQPDRWTPIA